MDIWLVYRLTVDFSCSSISLRISLFSRRMLFTSIWMSTSISRSSSRVGSSLCCSFVGWVCRWRYVFILSQRYRHVWSFWSQCRVAVSSSVELLSLLLCLYPLPVMNFCPAYQVFAVKDYDFFILNLANLGVKVCSLKKTCHRTSCPLELCYFWLEWFVFFMSDSYLTWAVGFWCDRLHKLALVLAVLYQSYPAKQDKTLHIIEARHLACESKPRESIRKWRLYRFYNS